MTKKYSHSNEMFYMFVVLTILPTHCSLCDLMVCSESLCFRAKSEFNVITKYYFNSVNTPRAPHTLKDMFVFLFIKYR